MGWDCFFSFVRLAGLLMRLATAAANLAVRPTHEDVEHVARALASSSIDVLGGLHIGEFVGVLEIDTGAPMLQSKWDAVVAERERSRAAAARVAIDGLTPQGDDGGVVDAASATKALARLSVRDGGARAAIMHELAAQGGIDIRVATQVESDVLIAPLVVDLLQRHKCVVAIIDDLDEILLSAAAVSVDDWHRVVIVRQQTEFFFLDRWMRALLMRLGALVIDQSAAVALVWTLSAVRIVFVLADCSLHIFRAGWV